MKCEKCNRNKEQVFEGKVHICTIIGGVGKNKVYDEGEVIKKNFCKKCLISYGFMNAFTILFLICAVLATLNWGAKDDVFTVIFRYAIIIGAGFVIAVILTLLDVFTNKKCFIKWADDKLKSMTYSKMKKENKVNVSVISHYEWEKSQKRQEELRKIYEENEKNRDILEEDRPENQIKEESKENLNNQE